MHRALLLAASLLMCDCAAGQDNKTVNGGAFDVYLLIGQSNMAGRGYMLPGDTSGDIDGVWLLDGSGTPIPARNPLNACSTVRKDIRHQGINPGTAFGTAIHAATGRDILLVVNALGGSAIGAWQKDAPLITDTGSINYGTLQLYAEAVRRTRQAMQYGQLKGILWHQGESNSSNPGAYPAQLARMVADLREDLNAPQVPFIAGELAYWRATSAQFNLMIRGIADFIPHSAWISAEDAGPLIDESDPHFNRDGQLLLGGRYAEKILEMVY